MNEVEVELLFYAFENVSREEIQVHYVSSSVRREIDSIIFVLDGKSAHTVFLRISARGAYFKFGF